MPRFAGTLATGLYILAWMIVWGFLIRTLAATTDDDARSAAAAKGASFVIG